MMHFEQPQSTEGLPTPLGAQSIQPPPTSRKSVLALLPLLVVKGKFSLLVLLKMGGFLISLGLYTLIFGWQFAVLFMLLLATHELGHYVVMRYYGIDASLPLFIPGLGAMIFTRSMQKLSIAQQAIVGMAGPVVGTAAAVAFAAYGFQVHSGLWIAAGYSGFFLNVFNLLPVPPLDGSHVVNVVSSRLWAVGLIIFAALSLTVPTMRNPLVLLIVLMSVPQVINAWRGRNIEERAPVPLLQRIAFCLAYFTLAGIDFAGMLATHIGTNVGG